MATIEVEADCDYCGEELACPSCNPEDFIPTPTNTSTPYAQLAPQVRRSIITHKPRCACDTEGGTWSLCPYHLGMQHALDLQL